MALVKCKDCGNEMSTDAKKCPKCGANPPTSTGKKIVYGIVSLFVLFILVPICSSNKTKPSTAATAAVQEADQPVTFLSESCAEVAQKFDASGKMTDLQKKSVWERYDKQHVKWSGTVKSVSETFGSLSVQIKCRSQTFGSDVIVSFDDQWKNDLLQLKEGQKLTFTAELRDYNQLLGISARNGAIAK